MQLNYLITLCLMFFAFMLMFIAFPFLILGINYEKSGGGEKYMYSLILSVFLSVSAVYVLSFLNIMSGFTFILLIVLLALIYLLLIKQGKTLSWFISIINTLTRYFEGYYKGFVIREKVSTFFDVHIKSSLKYYSKDNFVNTLIFLVCFLLAVYSRAHYALNNIALGSADSFLQADIALNIKNGNMFSAGIYPYGFYNVMAAFEAVFGFDIYTVLRFFGVFTGINLLIIFYVFIKRLFSSNLAVNVAFALFCLSDILAGNILFRQGTPMVFEFSLIFLFPMIYCLEKFISERNPRDVIFFSLSFAILVFCHLFTAVSGLIASLLIILANADKLKDMRRLGNIFTGIIASVIAAVIPLATGFYIFDKQYALLNDFLVPVYLSAESAGSGFTRMWFAAALACAGLMIFYSIIILKNPGYNRNGRFILSIAVFGIFAAVYASLSMFEVISVNNASYGLIIFLLIAPALLALPAHIFHYFCAKKEGWEFILKVGGTVIFCGYLIFILFGRGFYNINYTYTKSQHEGTVKTLYNIKKEFKNEAVTFAATIFEKPFEYEGFTYMPLHSLISGNSYAKTPYIFIFIEKRAMVPHLEGYRTKVENEEDYISSISAEDAQKPLTEAVERLYYMDLGHKLILESKAAEFMKKFSGYYRQEMNVYYEDENILVYKFIQDADFPVPFILRD